MTVRRYERAVAERTRMEHWPSPFAAAPAGSADLRKRLLQLRAGLLRCGQCGTKAMSLRNGTEPLCSLCAQIARQKRTFARLRAR